MKVDNFDLIRDFLEFKEPTDFYHLQVMLRKKDNPDASANNKLIKAYYIKSKGILRSSAYGDNGHGNSNLTKRRL